MKVEEWHLSATPRFMEDVGLLRIKEDRLELWERNLVRDPLIGEPLFEAAAPELRVYEVEGHSILYHVNFAKEKVQLHRLVPHTGRTLTERLRAAAKAGDSGARILERILGALSKL